VVAHVRLGPALPQDHHRVRTLNGDILLFLPGARGKLRADRENQYPNPHSSHVPAPPKKVVPKCRAHFPRSAYRGGILSPDKRSVNFWLRQVPIFYFYKLIEIRCIATISSIFCAFILARKGPRTVSKP